ncbi:hypothetical protein FQA39_LY03800 [Lamprigera yunnana]|nr:hypothetical protein FQA39_LY03800 [Lamprigera yunnana]
MKVLVVCILFFVIVSAYTRQLGYKNELFRILDEEEPEIVESDEEEDRPLDSNVDPHYAFLYETNDNNFIIIIYYSRSIKSHRETREGVVKGQYFIVEPDGSRRIVQFTTNKLKPPIKYVEPEQRLKF